MTCRRRGASTIAFMLACTIAQRQAFATTAFVSLATTRSFRRFSLTSSSSSSIPPLHVASSSSSRDTNSNNNKMLNLHTIRKEDLEQVLVSWGYPKYRADQVWKWIRQGATDVEEMTNVPKTLRSSLRTFATMGSLTLDTELVSRKDGTIKRAYRLYDNQLIESVLMPYDDGRYTACISSQAGCAMGCVFCATGQMGFARQLTPEEIFEQVSRFASELARDNARLSNVVLMGMGEPLANYRNVREAIKRITTDLGVGARKITISTVGVVPGIRKLMTDADMPQVRLAVSLHCASDGERSALIPANDRYGGLPELMTTLREYIDTTGRRITLEWALIEGQNDTPQMARRLGELVRTYRLRRDMVHVNVIPLNPTGGFRGSPSGRGRVNEFIDILQEEFGISATPRVRRGIDIDAGCGQLKSKIQRKEERTAARNDVGGGSVLDQDGAFEVENTPSSPSNRIVEFPVDSEAVDFESDDYVDPEFVSEVEQEEAARLISLVQESFPSPPITADERTTAVSIVQDDAIRETRQRRKKLLKNLKAIRKLQELQQDGRELNEEQLAKVEREEEWKSELERVQQNLQ